MPGERHETVKERIGALLELYLLMAGFDFTSTGSMTLESEAGAVKREADKSYKLAPGRVRPDLVIEVVFTSGGLNKLSAYKRLLIREKIAVEIKSFISTSNVSEFHTALGQFLNYRDALDKVEPDRLLYLAVRVPIYESFFQRKFIASAVKKYQLRLIIYDVQEEVIRQWL
ncbi:hypothetical protein NUACC21_18700 [Scytonema sp. NUACC21]